MDQETLLNENIALKTSLANLIGSSESLCKTMSSDLIPVVMESIYRAKELLNLKKQSQKGGI